MTKPTAAKIEAYDILSIAEHVSEKYNLDLDLNDVWHWFQDRYEADNGSYLHFSTDSRPTDKEWVKTMLAHLKTEYGDSIPLLTEW